MGGCLGRGIKMWAAFLLGVSVTAVCDESCLSLCHQSRKDSDCYLQCECEFSAIFPSQIRTEDGRVFSVDSVPFKPKNSRGRFNFKGCEVECADVCFLFAVGSAQLDCALNRCGCGAIITEWQPFLPGPQLPTTPVKMPNLCERCLQACSNRSFPASECHQRCNSCGSNPRL